MMRVAASRKNGTLLLVICQYTLRLMVMAKCFLITASLVNGKLKSPEKTKQILGCSWSITLIRCLY